jgi:hypothetical protein
MAKRPRKYRFKLETEELIMILILKYGLHLTTRMIFLKTAMVLLKQTRNGTRDQEKTMLRCIISLVLILD